MADNENPFNPEQMNPEAMMQLANVMQAQMQAQQGEPETVVITVVCPGDSHGRGLYLLEGSLRTLEAMDPGNCTVRFVTVGDTEVHEDWFNMVGEVGMTQAENDTPADLVIKVGTEESETYTDHQGPKWELPL